jgi:hypothetical protein
MPKFLLEVIFERPTLNEHGQFLNLETTLFSFEHPEKDVAYQDAVKELERISREGLELSGGALVKSIIMPNCIKQVGIVDYELYEAENSAIESESSPAPAEMPVVTESALVNPDVVA